MNEVAKPHKGLNSLSIYAEKVPTKEHVASAIMNTLYNMIKTRQKLYSIHSPHSPKIRIQKDTAVKVQFLPQSPENNGQPYQRIWTDLNGSV